VERDGKSQYRAGLPYATLLPSGKVLLAGGTADSGPTASAEIYDPKLGSWSITGNLTTARTIHSASLLSTGEVLAAGGTNTIVLAGAELFRPR
jgi:hypothetical protein